MTRIRPILFSCIVLLACSTSVLAAAPAHHSLVQLYLDSPAAQQYLDRNYSQLDVLMVKPGVLVQIAATADELQTLRASGLKLDVLEDDMETAYTISDKAVGFGAFHTYSENVAFVDSLRLLYPNLVSEKWSIGQTHLNQDIWCFRVSDNPDVDENEPEILIDGMHHAREIMASEFPILFAEYLAQNYGTDPEITWLLDNRELYLVPIVNPDGVLYNESTNPGGGGMWRKNRRNNGDGTYGVDPNRNYPYQWGYDDIGSSPSPINSTYRGPSAGSEPEVQALMGLIAAHDFVTHNTVHCYGNLTLFPWGYTTLPTSDAAAFVKMGDEMCKFNGYDPGQPYDAINYSVNGGTFDWTYGVHGVLSFSNEIGASGDGFWPSEARRIPLFTENIWPNIYLMRAAGAFVSAHSAVTTPLAKAIGPGESGLFDFTLENQGATEASSVMQLTITTDDAWLQLDEAQRSVSSLPALTTTTLGAEAIPFSVESGCPNGHFAVINVNVPMPEGDLDFPLSVLVGSPSPIFADDLESGDADWTLTGNWSLTTEQAHSGTYSLTDSPGAEYNDSSSTSATLNDSYIATRISFWQKYIIEEDWDYGRVQVSVDGAPWTTIYSATGTMNSWQFVELDLDLYLGSELQFRFLLDTDTSVTEDGWWIDDITIEGFSQSNLPPSTPEVAIPTGLPSGGNALMGAIWNSTDPEGAPLTYGVRVFTDELGTQPVLTELNIAEGESVTEFWLTGLPDGDYWWRAWAFDGEQRSLMSAAYPATVSEGSPVGDSQLISAGLQVLGGVTGRDARLQLNLPRAGTVALDVYDARGARIRRLHSGNMQSGSRMLTWDGRDGAGRNVSSGVYLVRMQYAGSVYTGRVVMVR